MSQFYPDQFTTSARDAAMDAFTQWLTGSGGDPPKDLLERVPLEELKAAAESMLAQMADPEATVDRMRVMYALALFRDASLAYATRGQLLTGMANGQLVELYEGALLTEAYGR